jgi:hypothetical protein
MSKSFKIGEHVKLIGDDELAFEIIATTAIPHVAVDKAVISVPTGREYVLRMLNQKKLFESYRYVLGRDIEKLS